MSKVDLIVCNPRDTYYPFFVWRINKDRELFNNVIIVMTEPNLDFDFTKEIKKMKQATVLQPDILKLTAGGKDWRNVAIQEGLKYSSSDYILFLEQDFLVKNNFFKELLEKGEKYNAVGFVDGNRFHPACLLVKREALNKTSKDFSAYPPQQDHFAKFSKELMDLNNWATLEYLGLTDFYHMAGLTHNFRLDKNFYQSRQFFTYLACSGEIDQPEEWVEFSVKKMHQSAGYSLDNKIKSFFEETENEK